MIARHLATQSEQELETALAMLTRASEQLPPWFGHRPESAAWVALGHLYRFRSSGDVQALSRARAMARIAEASANPRDPELRWLQQIREEVEASG